MDTIRCGNCEHYVEEQQGGPLLIGQESHGQCRFNPPQVVSVMTPKGQALMAVYPPVQRGTYPCSHHSEFRKIGKSDKVQCDVSLSDQQK